MTFLTKSVSFFLSLGLPIFLFAETATLKVYTSLLDYESLFSSDSDVQLLSYSLDDAGLSSNKVKVSGSMSVLGIYTTFTGEFDFPFVNQDNNLNGIYDFFEPDQSYSMSISGSATYVYQGLGSYSANLFGSINRISSQHSFSLDQTVSVQSSSISGVNVGRTESVNESLTAIHALGTITYDRDAGTYNYSLGFYGTTGSSTGSGTYQVNQDNSLSFSEFTFPSMNESSMASSAPGLAQKTLSGTVTIPYAGNGKFHVMTILNGVPYYVVIEDSNDGDGDSFPDLIRSQAPAVESVDLGGWNYHIWPWVYSQNDNDWLYYHQMNSGWVVWRNKSQKWFLYDPDSGYWKSN